MKTINIDEKTMTELADIQDHINRLSNIQNAVLTAYARAGGLSDGEWIFDGKNITEKVEKTITES